MPISPYSNSSGYSSSKLYSGTSNYGYDNDSNAGTKGKSAFLAGNTANLLKNFAKNEEDKSPRGRKQIGNVVSQYSNLFEAKCDANKTSRPREIDTKNINYRDRPARAVKPDKDESNLSKNHDSIRRDREVVRLTSKREDKYEDLFAVKDKTIKSIAQRLLEKYTVHEPKPVDPYEYVPKNRRLATNSIDVSAVIDISPQSISNTSSVNDSRSSSINENVNKSTVKNEKETENQENSTSQKEVSNIDLDEATIETKNEEDEDDTAARLQRATEAAINKEHFENAEEIKDAIVAAALLPDVDIESDEEMKKLVETDNESSKSSSKSESKKIESSCPSEDSNVVITSSDVLVNKLKKFVKDQSSIKRGSKQSSKTSKKISLISEIDDDKITDKPIVNRSSENNSKSDSCTTSIEQSKERSSSSKKSKNSSLRQSKKSLNTKLSTRSSKSNESQKRSRKNSFLTPEYNIITGLEKEINVSVLEGEKSKDDDSDEDVVKKDSKKTKKRIKKSKSKSPRIDSIVESDKGKEENLNNVDNKETCDKDSAKDTKKDVESEISISDKPMESDTVISNEKSGKKETCDDKNQEKNESDKESIDNKHETESKESSKDDKTDSDNETETTTETNETKSIINNTKNDSKIPIKKPYGVPNALIKPGFEDTSAKKVWKKPAPQTAEKAPVADGIKQARNVLKKPMKPKEEAPKNTILEELKVKKVWKKPAQLPIKPAEQEVKQKSAVDEPIDKDTNKETSEDNTKSNAESVSNKQHLSASKSADSAYGSSPSTPQPGGATSEVITSQTKEEEEKTDTSNEQKTEDSENEEICKSKSNKLILLCHV